MNMSEIPEEKKVDSEVIDADSGRRRFLQGAALGVIGAVAAAPAFAQATNSATQAGGETLDQLRQDMMAGIEDDIKKDLELRAKATEELPKPASLRPGGMLDNRFPVSYKVGVPEAMRLLTAYFAAMSDNDMPGVASTLHFPYATYEGTEPLVYRNGQEFTSNPPPSLHLDAGKDSQRRPGTYDILDVLQLQSFNAVNVGLELCYTRYRADGYKIGINQGIYAITNNDGKWGIQLSSIIFTPSEYIGQTYNDAVEAHLRQGRSGMAAFGDHDYDLLTRGQASPAAQARAARKTASVANAPGATLFFLSAWAGKPMEPYNSKGKMSRLAVTGFPDAAAINAAQGAPNEIQQYERPLGKTNIVTASGKPGWFYAMAGSGVGHYSYTNTLADAKVLHAGPEKAHALGGYIRYTPDHLFVSETRSLGIMIYDLHTGTWGTGGGLGQSIRRDRTNDASPEVGSLG
jgi:hypothetical protein